MPTNGDIHFGVLLVGEVEDGLAAELFLSSAEHERVALESVLFGHWDPVCNKDQHLRETRGEQKGSPFGPYAFSWKVTIDPVAMNFLMPALRASRRM